jgi:hypothetical protein
MLSLIDRWVKFCAWDSSEIEWDDYMFGAFMLIWLGGIGVGILAVLGFALYITLPWSAPVVGLILAVFGIFWYAWRHNDLL